MAKSVVRQLDDIEADGGEGELDFGRGKTLHVSSLDKVFFPKAGFTKGDIMRYYASVAPVLLRSIRDRPMILKRFPDGIGGSSFYQQNAGANLPDVVRTKRIGSATRIIAGDLPTLLYTVQIGTIAVHTWQSRVQSHQYADTTTIDLDPGDDVPFADVVTLAKYIKVELDNAGLKGAIKTSGANGLHIALPLPPKTVHEVAARVAAGIARRVVEAHPDLATVERSLRSRPSGTIYVDAQQNAQGKSVVAAYSVREQPVASVSAPLAWKELRRTLRLESFTIKTMPTRLRRVGDLWGSALKRRNTQRAIDRVLGDSGSRRVAQRRRGA